MRENTELKVDKVTLQRDLKHQRRSLAQAERDLEYHKLQLLDYAEKLKRRQGGGEMQQELDRLRQALSDKDAEIQELQNRDTSDAEKDAQIIDLQDEIGDLQQDIRAKEMDADQQQEEIDRLKEQASTSTSAEELDELRQQLQEKENEIKGYEEEIDQLKEQASASTSTGELEELRQQLQEKEDDIKGYEDTLRQVHIETEQKLSDKERRLEAKDDELRELEEELGRANHQTALDAKESELRGVQAEMKSLKEKLDDAAINAKEDVTALRAQLVSAKSEAAADLREKSRAIEDREAEIHTLRQKLESAEGRDTEAEKLHDEIEDLNAELQDKQNAVDERQDQVDELREKVQQVENDIDEELISAQDRIQELETAQQRHLKELQTLRDAGSRLDDQALEAARHRATELENENRKLEREIDDQHNDSMAERQKWDRQRTTLETAKANIEQQAKSLERTIEELQRAEGSLSGREMALQQALQHEKQRHDSSRAALQKELDASNDEFARLQQSLTKAEETERRLRRELDVVNAQCKKDVDAAQRNGSAEAELRDLRSDLQSVQTEKQELQDKVQGLEDEIEVWQATIDEEADKAKNEMQGLQQKLVKAQTKYATAQSEVDALRLAPGALSPQSHSDLQLQQRLHESQSHNARLRKERQSLEAEYATAKADLEALQINVEDTEAARASAQELVRDLRKQLKDQQREADRRLQTQINAYETDINNLEQDLEAAQSKNRESSAKNESLASSITRLKTRLTSLETDLATARISGNTSVGERKELHDMLRDAKLKAEDLALQLSEREGRAKIASKREGELRDQLQRAQEEGRMTMDEQALRKTKHRHTLELRGLARQIEYLSARLRREEAFRQDLSYSKRYANRVLELYAKVHKLDLGLVRDMGVAVDDVCAQEERQCNAGRVRRLHVAAVDTRVADAEAYMPGVDATPRGKKSGASRKITVKPQKDTRPTLRSVAFMVLASVRMQRGAESWRGVRKSHEGLLKKLNTVRKDRERREGATKATR